MHSLIEKRLRNRQDELRGGLADHPHGRRADPRYRYESSPQLELREVESALRRLEDRTYGICRQCGQPIADGRLYAVPHTEPLQPLRRGAVSLAHGARDSQKRRQYLCRSLFR